MCLVVLPCYRDIAVKHNRRYGGEQQLRDNCEVVTAMTQAPNSKD